MPELKRPFQMRVATEIKVNLNMYSMYLMVPVELVRCLQPPHYLPLWYLYSACANIIVLSLYKIYL